jgi:hypothetical protein
MKLNEVNKIGAPEENRTPTSKGNWILNPARLPVPPQGHRKICDRGTMQLLANANIIK